jgi:hypothetical protein
MLLSIYIASLIALSSGMAVQQEASMPSKCYLFLYVRAAAKGWIRLTNDFLSLTALDPQGPESRTEFSKATEFVLPPNTNPGEFDTVYNPYFPILEPKDMFICACMLTDCIS